MSKGSCWRLLAVQGAVHPSEILLPQYWDDSTIHLLRVLVLLLGHRSFCTIISAGSNCRFRMTGYVG